MANNTNKRRIHNTSPEEAPKAREMRCVRLRVRAFGQWSLMPEAGERAASAKELKCPKYVRDCGLRVLHVSFSALGPKVFASLRSRAR